MKKTSIAFILAFLSQSALASDDFEIKNLDILAYSGSQDVSLMDAISGDQWDVSSIMPHVKEMNIKSNYELSQK